MPEDSINEDYSADFSYLEEDLLLQQLDDVIDALEEDKAVETKNTLPDKPKTKQSLKKDVASLLGRRNKQQEIPNQYREVIAGIELDAEITVVYKRKRHRSSIDEPPETQWDYLVYPRWYFGDKEPRKWDDDKILRVRLLLSDYRNLVVNDYIPLEAEYELYDILNELYEDEDPEENW
ncbi:hypothetical protein [Coprothermobacter platensis]|uniref:hypothetical protein n=1 Tax=Coprothermobacter platensis TaxID=108819 RepID=UPI0003732A82|nr:hypothetical protein [Coprothermobacter platensis]